MPQPWSPVLTTEATEAGQAIAAREVTLEDGTTAMRPLVIGADGNPTPFNIGLSQDNLQRANREAEQRRKLNDQAAQILSEAMGVEFASDRETRLNLLGEHLGKLAPMLAQLKDLQALQEAGKLGDDPAALDAKAREIAQERLDAKDKELSDVRATLTQTQQDLQKATDGRLSDQRNVALREWHRSHGNFREGTEQMFQDGASGDLDGYSWTPTGQTKEGIPVMELRDANGTAKMDAAQQSPLTLDAWAETDGFRKKFGALLNQPAGSNEPNPAMPEGVEAQNATRDQLLDAVNADYGANGA